MHTVCENISELDILRVLHTVPIIQSLMFNRFSMGVPVPVPYPHPLNWNNHLLGESLNLTIVEKVHQCSDNDYLAIIHRHNQHQTCQMILKASMECPDGFGMFV